MSRLVSRKGELAIVPPTFTKIEAKMHGGMATIAQRTDVIEVELVMDYTYNGIDLHAGDKIVLRGDAGLQPWAKTQYSIQNRDFVLCPETAIIAVRCDDTASLAQAAQ
ncbi:MAG: hypothetical protein ACREGB_04120 [Candidatus Saccharimonadales bacterium]